MKGLREKVAAHGEACRLGEVLARDLPLAAYLHSMAQPHLADKVSPETVLSVLDRIRRWVEATGQTTKGKPPKVVASSHWLLEHTELDLQQLILWTAALLLPLCREDAKQAAVRPADKA